MDPELLKQRDAFRKRAAQQPSVIKKLNAERDNKGSVYPQKPANKRPKTMASALSANTDLKAVTPSSSAHFGILVKIIDHMKKRHLEQLNWGLSLDEILEEIQVFDITNKAKYWLLNEALPNNRRIATNDEGKFVYRPPYNVKGKNSLLKLLKRHDLDGKGGVLFSDLADCVPNPDKLLQGLGNAVSAIPTSVSKKKDRVLFYNDPESAVNIDEEFRALWRSVAVEHLDEKKVEEYLNKHGITSMKDLAPKKNVGAPKRKPVRRGKGTVMHNEHLAEGVLKDYSIE